VHCLDSPINYSSLFRHQRIVGFADPSSLPANPGWPLRNFLVLLQHQWLVKQIKVLCFREIPGKKDISQSIFLTVKLPESVSAGQIRLCSWNFLAIA